MKCHEFDDRLHRLLDDRQPPEDDPQLAAHASVCEPCGQMLTGQMLLLAGLRQAVAPPTGQFARGVVAQYRAEPVEAVVLDSSRIVRRIWQAALWVAATAAALAIAVSIYLSSQPSIHPIARNENTARNANTAKPSTRPNANSPTAKLANTDAPSAKGTRARAGSIQLLPRPVGGYGVAIADMASSLPEAVERIEQVERYAPGIRPIRVSFSMLWDAVWRAIPGLCVGDLTGEARWSYSDVRWLV